MALVRFSKQSVAAFMGLFAAPIVPALYSALFFGAPPTDFFGRLAAISVLYAVALALGSLVGLPILFVLGRLRCVTWWSVLIGGSLTGALIAALLSVQLKPILVFATEGAGAAAMFWVWWRAGPDPTAESAVAWIRGLIRYGLNE